MRFEGRLKKIESVITVEERMPLVVIANSGETRQKVKELRDKYNDYTSFMIMLPPVNKEGDD